MRILPEQCANCGLCSEVCPVAAVEHPTPANGLPAYKIDPERCTECVGSFAWSRCATFCRMNAIVLDTGRFESRTTLMRKWRRLTGGKAYGEEPPYGLEPVEEVATAAD